MIPMRPWRTPSRSAASWPAYSVFSRRSTSGRKSVTRRRTPGSDARARMPAKISRITRTPCSSCERPGSEPKTASSRSCGGSPSGWKGRPAAATVSRAEAGAATITVSPALRKAFTKGTSGPTWPAPGFVVMRIRIGNVTVPGPPPFPGQGSEISTDVPCPGAEDSLNSPPSDSALSRMLIRPKLASERGSDGSKPSPSSVTRSQTPSASRR
jgi:hypothetical protein